MTQYLELLRHVLEHGKAIKTPGMLGRRLSAPEKASMEAASALVKAAWANAGCIVKINVEITENIGKRKLL
jgi:hypothetical protein